MAENQQSRDRSEPSQQSRDRSERSQQSRDQSESAAADEREGAVTAVKLPDPTKPLTEQDDDVLLAMCVFGEARGEPMIAKLAVANVVQNRLYRDLARYGRSWRTVILHPYAFSCFLPNDPNLPKLFHPLDHEAPKVWEDCLAMACGVMKGVLGDNVEGATHYFDDSIAPPRWASRMTATVKLGRLNFFRES